MMALRLNHHHEDPPDVCRPGHAQTFGHAHHCSQELPANGQPRASATAWIHAEAMHGALKGAVPAGLN